LFKWIVSVVTSALQFRLKLLKLWVKTNNDTAKQVKIIPAEKDFMFDFTIIYSVAVEIKGKGNDFTNHKIANLIPN